MELIKAAEVAEMLGVSEETVKLITKAGILPAYRVTVKLTRYDRADVEEYLRQRRTKAAALARYTRVKKPTEFRGGVDNSGYYPGMQVVKVTK